MKDLEHFLREEGVSEALLEEAASFRLQHEAGGDDCRRVPDPPYRYYGKEVWEKAIAAILCGENLLLAGPKATGKNVLAENLACLFGRPLWNVGGVPARTGIQLRTAGRLRCAGRDQHGAQ